LCDVNYPGYAQAIPGMPLSSAQSQQQTLVYGQPSATQQVVYVQQAAVQPTAYAQQPPSFAQQPPTAVPMSAYGQSTAPPSYGQPPTAQQGALTFVQSPLQHPPTAVSYGPPPTQQPTAYGQPPLIQPPTVYGQLAVQQSSMYATGQPPTLQQTMLNHQQQQQQQQQQLLPPQSSYLGSLAGGPPSQQPPRFVTDYELPGLMSGGAGLPLGFMTSSLPPSVSLHGSANQSFPGKYIRYINKSLLPYSNNIYFYI